MMMMVKIMTGDNKVFMERLASPPWKPQADAKLHTPSSIFTSPQPRRQGEQVATPWTNYEENVLAKLASTPLGWSQAAKLLQRDSDECKIHWQQMKQREYDDSNASLLSIVAKLYAGPFREADTDVIIDWPKVH